MNEFDLIRQIKPKYYKQPNLIKGIGDDGAVFSSPNQQIVTAVDTFVEHVHFTEETMSMYQIGYRSLAASVSDLGAMGANPAFYLVSIIIPKQLSSTKFAAIFNGMKAFAKQYGIDLIGGDTVLGSEIAISITVIGYVREDKVRYRHDAKDDDIVFVTGTLGDSQAGLYVLQNKLKNNENAYFVKRHQLPEPRISFANELVPLKRVSLNDISDGIVNELYEIAEASEVNMIINDSHIPRHKHLTQFPEQLVEQWVYFGGEDFELVGTAPETSWDQIQFIGKQTETKVTKIGYVQNKLHPSTGHVFLRTNENVKLLDQEGYIHFK